MSILRVCVLCLVALLFGSCTLIQTTQPLSDPLISPADERLYGHWKALIPKDYTSRVEADVYIGRTGEEKISDAITEANLVFWDPVDKTTGAETGFFSTTRIGGETYLNVIDIVDGDPGEVLSQGGYAAWADEPGKYSILLRYEIEGSTLRLWIVARSGTTLRDLAAAGKIKIGKADLVTAESLAGYLGKNGGVALFGEPTLTLMRVP